MYLTKSEEKILAGEGGRIPQKALEILVALGKIYHADKLIPISSAQVAGVSYKNLGEAGLEFIRDWSEAKVKVRTTLNPAGADMDKKGLVPQDFYNKQKQVIDAYSSLGIEATCTCTPYYVGNAPKKGEHIAWSESSAVVYANSVLGAYTNREGGPSALAAAIIGKTPNYGYHLDENREPTIQINASTPLMDYAEYSALGYWIGKETEGVPIIDFGQRPKNEHLRGLSAGLGCGDKAMFLIGEGEQGLETAEFTEDHLIEVLDKFSADDFDLVVLGCPHLNIGEIARVARTVRNQKVRTPLWLFTSKKIKTEAFHKGYIDILSRAGVSLISDTCMVVMPLQAKSILTNSAKAAHYLSSQGKHVQLEYTQDCINYALGERKGGEDED